MKNSFTGILSKSDRAIQAEDRGLLKYSQLSAWQKRAVDAGAVGFSEWHHTSAAANRTYFYDPESFDELKADDYPPVAAAKVVQADVTRLRITVQWREMTGGFSRRARTKWEDCEIAAGRPVVRAKDNLIYAAADDEHTRRIDANNTLVSFSYLPPRCRKWREVSRREAIDLGYLLA